MRKISKYFQVAGCRLQGFRKQGAVNWTIGKLINIILLVVVLVLIVYGMTTGGLNPLIENLEMKFDEAIILVGDLFGQGVSSECYRSNIKDLGGGAEFLASIGAGGSNAVLEICRDGTCVVNGSDVGVYRLVDGKIDRFEGGEWKRNDFSDRAVAGKADWERYNAGVELLEDSGLREIYDDAFSGQFILYGDGSGAWDREIYATWQNGEWFVVAGKDWRGEENWFGATLTEKKTVFYNGSDDDKAIDAFVDVVWGGNDDKVSYKITSLGVLGGKYSSSGEGWISIGELVGDTWYSDKDELDDKKEVVKLKSEFERIKRELLDEVKLKISKENIEKIEALSGKSVSVGEKKFSVKVEKGFMEGGFQFPLVVFSFGEEEFGLKFTSSAKVNSGLLENVKLRDFPVSFVKWDEFEREVSVDEEIYRLPESDFKKMLSGDLISKFLRSKCK